jgi:IS5 family transposase
MTGQLGFWSITERLAEISAQGDPLETLAATVDFEMFRPVLARVLGERLRWKGGRPPFDPVLKFRMLVLQSLHGLSLEQTEYLVRDRLSWMRFCQLGPEDRVPDANTLWDFREALIRAGALDNLFERLDGAITAAGTLPRGGQIVDATLVAAPRQRNSEGEKARIKEGRTAAEIWPEKPAKARQKDVDARWTVKLSKAKARVDGAPQIARDCQGSCAGADFTQPTRNRSPKVMANWVRASTHSRGGRFQSAAARLRTKYSSLVAASSDGKCPLARTARRSLEFSASMAFVV